MRSKTNAGWIAFFLGLLVMIWLGVYLAPYFEHGIEAVMQGFESISDPSNWGKLSLCSKTVPVTLVIAGAYSLIGLSFMAGKGHFRPGEEHGSAKWANVKEMNRRYRDKGKHEKV